MDNLLQRGAQFPSAAEPACFRLDHPADADIVAIYRRDKLVLFGKTERGTAWLDDIVIADSPAEGLQVSAMLAAGLLIEESEHGLRFYVGG